MSAVRDFPAVVLLVLISSALMIIPALHAVMLENWVVARTFLYHSVFFVVLCMIAGIATLNRTPKIAARYHLMTLLATYIVLPVFLAAPLYSLASMLPSVDPITYVDVYFEMLACLTTTGATLIDRPHLIPEALHLWRAIIGWLGGLMALVTAYAVLAPLNLGGFEISQQTMPGQSSTGSIDDASRRIMAHTKTILPVYAGLTFVLALILIIAGDPPFLAISHAMATLSTSGISPANGLEASGSGRFGEVVLAVFLLSAVSYEGLTRKLLKARPPSVSDPQVQLMLICVLSVTLLLFLRSYWGAVEIERQGSLAATGRAIWGSVFTSLSFLTTMGFESRDWQAMQIWSGMSDPGVILLGLAVMGGGIATTAGGVKLLRIYALYRHGLREMDFLVHPSSLGRHGHGDKLISERGPQIAFVFMMLFLVTIATLMVLFSFSGLDFDHSIALSIASLTTTGPAIRTLGDGFAYSDLDTAAKLVFGVGMIIGRMEALVVIALFNPAYWRN